jgi:coatomer protein complex subunit alpha (xenin)
MYNATAGIVNFAPLRPLFLSLYAASRVSATTFPSAPSQTVFLQQAGQSAKATLPIIPLSLQGQIERLKGAYRATFEGKFSEAMTHFLSIAHTLLFIPLSSQQEVTEAKELLTICREYVLGLRMELRRKEDASNPSPDITRQVELSAYFTHCNLQPVHLMLALRSAMNTAYKAKNYGMASTFGRRLLELSPKQEVATQARKVVKFCERNQVDQMKVNYDFRNPFVVCAGTHVPIYQGTPLVRCPYCSAPHSTSYKGRVCGVCELAEVGKDCSGFVWLRS